jgi:hypothetical protein
MRETLFRLSLDSLLSPLGGGGFRPTGRDSRWVGRWGGVLWDVGRGLDER